MKVLVIYSNDSKKEVQELRKELAQKFGQESVLRLHSKNRKKTLIKHIWHRDALKMMKRADLIVYAVSEQSYDNKNVQWELKKAIKLDKHLVCLPIKPGIEARLNEFLYVIDKDTKEKICLVDTISSEEELFKIIENFDNNSHLKLFNDDLDEAVLFEQYKIFSQTAENLVERRQHVNSFYISANTALITVGGTIFAIGNESSLLPKILVVCALTIPGFLLNYSWKKMLQSYFINNQGKMKVLSMIEKRLAVSLYDAEWKAMKNRYNQKEYVSFTENEKKLPSVFNFFYLLICIFGAATIIYLAKNGLINNLF